MKDRIKQIMENENLTPAQFADRLQINRAVISHILNGRNNPSLDVVVKILNDMNDLNPEWLLNGTEPMYKTPRSNTNAVSMPKTPDLFSERTINPIQNTAKLEFAQEKPLKRPVNTEQIKENELIEPSQNSAKKITQIIIYYDDNTFETFIPPLLKN
ncbi:MAG TPA: transcriptional regulator [Porphyromonadaceae bacterium]|jgi:transcriptional regulator with XRE-family HTH domain|nr:transcriptional regulator [Porphyromonadaceae bacterium]HBL33089.1 transcriptional regulator [Porphyromonadaceae bacterium]HBX20295.1 transcriptional regulator [Porphyromonadaceae bacterium]HCM19610.1 transcriptional regulator [Porphyromonadaceae bacterium]